MAGKFRTRLRDFWQRIGLKWYEVLTAILAVLILAGAFLAWWFGGRTLQWLVEIAAPACLAWGALSIILLWAQLRSASNQERSQATWKRIESMHEHFRDVPRLELTEAVRGYLLELGIHSPPSAHKPLTPEQAKEIDHDKGSANRPPAMILISRFLNDWEAFCGAISVGVVDEDYAREMEGTRVIDAFFGYREVINRFRESRTQDGKSAGTSGAPPFVTKLYYELQSVAVQWHKKRTEEWNDQEEKIAAANREADLLRDQAQAVDGVPPKAKDRLEGNYRGRH